MAPSALVTWLKDVFIQRSAFIHNARIIFPILVSFAIPFQHYDDIPGCKKLVSALVVMVEE
jgi:hypothetical protein